jgi:hypothetical protein
MPTTHDLDLEQRIRGLIAALGDRELPDPANCTEFWLNRGKYEAYDECIGHLRRSLQGEET